MNGMDILYQNFALCFETVVKLLCIEQL